MPQRRALYTALHPALPLYGGRNLRFPSAGTLAASRLQCQAFFWPNQGRPIQARNQAARNGSEVVQSLLQDQPDIAQELAHQFGLALAYLEECQAPRSEVLRNRRRNSAVGI